MKKYNTPIITISKFESDICTAPDASMGTLQNWAPENGHSTTTKMVDFQDAVTLIF